LSSILFPWLHFCFSGPWGVYLSHFKNFLCMYVCMCVYCERASMRLLPYYFGISVVFKAICCCLWLFAYRREDRLSQYPGPGQGVRYSTSACICVICAAHCSCLRLHHCWCHIGLIETVVLLSLSASSTVLLRPKRFLIFFKKTEKKIKVGRKFFRNIFWVNRHLVYWSILPLNTACAIEIYRENRTNCRRGDIETVCLSSGQAGLFGGPETFAVQAPKCFGVPGKTRVCRFSGYINIFSV